MKGKETPRKASIPYDRGECGWAVELLVVLLLWLIFAFSFKLSSPVHGMNPTRDFPTEVFEQDSRYIMDALVDGKRFLGCLWDTSRLA